jgi:hypothetical protein
MQIFPHPGEIGFDPGDRLSEARVSRHFGP